MHTLLKALYILLRVRSRWDEENAYVPRIKKVLVPDLSKKKKKKKKKSKGRELLLKTPVKTRRQYNLNILNIIRFIFEVPVVKWLSS